MKILDYIKDKNILPASAVALGKFEGIHLGHRLLIDGAVAYAREQDITSVVFTICQPGAARIYTRAERAEILTGLNVDVDMECAFTPEFMALSPEKFVEQVLVESLHATCVFVGEDFRFGKDRAGNADTLRELGEKYGFRVSVYEKLCMDGSEISSSRIRDLLAEGRIAQANALLGRAYTVSGTVREGKRLGNTIGFPTLNLYPEREKLLPLPGVYGTEVLVDGKTYRAITNVGSNPTVEHGKELKVESHLLDFDENAYGKEIEVRFLSFVREERRFPSINELKNQIKSDILSLVANV